MFAVHGEVFITSILPNKNIFFYADFKLDLLKKKSLKSESKQSIHF